MHAAILWTVTLLPAAEPATPIDFDTEVVPVLTRAGCNTGACHGAAIGRGGFKLSLWGSDPAADYSALVHELESRRINLARPEESLLLRKPTRQVKHGGGHRLDKGGLGAERLLAWLTAGAPRLQRRKLSHFAVVPAEQVVEKLSDRLTLKALARFDDGSSEDVTPWTVFTADDPAAVEIDDTARVTLQRRGPSTVIARYLDRVVPVRFLVPLGEAPVDLRREERRSFLDQEVLAVLETLRLPVAPVADDAAFLRRVSLDLTGTLPAPDDVRGFVADRGADKRAKRIDRLLASDDFVDFWTLKWGNLLRISSRSLGQEGAKAFHDWVRDQVARNRPLDEMARTLVTALGDRTKVGPANFARIPANGREDAHVSRVLMGVRLQCANCHNHPLDRWTQDDYHGLATVFARLDRQQVVRLSHRGEIIHPRTGEPALPRLPGTRFLDEEADNREAFARWLTDSDNPYFARSVVNRLWKEMLGRGLVEPVDDLRETNPATHPVLLNKLADDFVKHGFDVRHTLRRIANSATYQRGGQTTAVNQSDDRFYSHALSRPLPAEVHADALAAVTGVSDRYGNLPEGTRAITLYDSQIPSPALDLLGRCSRAAPCEEEAFRAGGLAKTLHLINGPLLNRKITAAEGRLAKLLEEQRSNAEVVEEFYLRAFSRPPDAKEKAFWEKSLENAREPKERREVFEDFLWSLLTSRELTTNH